MNVEDESEQSDLLDATKRGLAQCPSIQPCHRQRFFCNNLKRVMTLASMGGVKLVPGVPVDRTDE